MLLLICALAPMVLGALLPLLRTRRRGLRMAYAVAAACLTSGLALYLLITGQGAEEYELFRLSDAFRFALRLDGAGKVYLALAAALWPPAMLYAVEYMAHEEREGNFFAWYIIAYGPAMLLAAAGNLFTLYMAYELLTLCTVPLVWHKRDEESNRAALKYMLYLIGGAALGFAALAGMAGYGLGAFDGGASAAVRPADGWFQIFCLLGFLGFGVKAAVLPLSHWLPAASVAPTPVTALLHAVAVVNAGVFAVARFLYCVFPASWLQGSWAQTVMLSFAAATLLFGAVMAVREQHVKRRLVWSTVSNLSYMLLGLSLLTEQGMAAGLAHMIFHSLMKIILFFCAGAVTIYTGRTQVREMRGLGKRLRLLFLCFALAGASLLGVPPMPGFVSKYALVTAAFAQGSAIAVVGAAALLVASVLTVIYIFTIVYPAFFMNIYPPEAEAELKTPGTCMNLTFVFLSLLLIGAAVFAGPIMAYLTTLAGGVFS